MPKFTVEKVNPVIRFEQSEVPLTQFPANRAEQIADAVSRLYEYGDSVDHRAVTRRLFGDELGDLFFSFPYREAKVIDTTDMYFNINSKAKAWECDLTSLDLTPSFDAAIYAYAHSTSPVVDMLCLRTFEGGEALEYAKAFEIISDTPELMEDIKWVISGLQMLYGIADSGRIGVYPIGTTGFGITHEGRYVYGWRAGNPDLSDQPGFRDSFDMATTVTMMTQNIANCANVEWGVPHYPRAERRRLERKGVVVGKLMITDQRKSYKSTGNRIPNGEPIPLTDVRGHVAHYGACCDWHEPRGKLFGKYDRKIYVPPHARGSEEFGKKRNDYEVKLTSD